MYLQLLYLPCALIKDVNSQALGCWPAGLPLRGACVILHVQ